MDIYNSLHPGDIVLVCGDRNWTNAKAIDREINRLPVGVSVMHGCCGGVDTMAGESAIRRGLAVLRYAANWRQYGRAAGPIRNRQMLARGPKLVLAFHANLTQSKGTKDMVQIATAAGVPVKVFDR